MKKIFFLLILTSINVFSQEKSQALERFFKIEWFLDKVSVGYEFPFSEKFVADVNLGYGIGMRSFPRNEDDEHIFHEWFSDLSVKIRPFIRGETRYYFNRDYRKRNGHFLGNNSGSFLGFQTKLNFFGLEGEGLLWLNEVHFGQQLPLGKRTYFRYHLGYGRGINFPPRGKDSYFSIGLFFGHVL